MSRWSTSAGRLSTAAAAAALALAAVFWVMAFTVATSAPPVILVVGAPEKVLEGHPLFVRAAAIDAVRKQRVTGRFDIAVGETLDAIDLVGRVELTLPVGKHPVVVTGPERSGPGASSGWDPGLVTFTVVVVDKLEPRATFRFRPWEEGLKVGGPGSPVYAVDGDLVSTRPGTLLYVHTTDGSVEGLEVALLTPNPADTRDRYRRILVLTHRDVGLAVPTFSGAGSELAYSVRPAPELQLDVLVDGWTRQLALVAPGSQKTPQSPEQRAPITIPTDARLGAPYVVHVADGPFPQSKGVWAVGIVGTRVDLRRELVALVERGGGQDDPLLAWLRKAWEVEEGSAPTQELNKRIALAEQALLRRLVPERLRAPRRGATSAEQKAAGVTATRSKVDVWRWPFRAFGLLFALLSARVLVLFVRERRRLAAALQADLDEVAAEQASVAEMGSVAEKSSVPEGRAADRDLVEADRSHRTSAMAGLLSFGIGLGLLALLDWALGVPSL